jgi:hypothetical protein
MNLSPTRKFAAVLAGLQVLAGGVTTIQLLAPKYAGLIILLIAAVQAAVSTYGSGASPGAWPASAVADWQRRFMDAQRSGKPPVVLNPGGPVNPPVPFTDPGGLSGPITATGRGQFGWQTSKGFVPDPTIGLATTGAPDGSGIGGEQDGAAGRSGDQAGAAGTGGQAAG